MFIFAHEIRLWKENMKTNRIMDEIRSTISPEMKLQMEMSVSIANRIYEILEAKGMTQKDLVVHQEESSPAYEFEPMMASEPLSDPKP